MFGVCRVDATEVETAGLDTKKQQGKFNLRAFKYV